MTVNGDSVKPKPRTTLPSAPVAGWRALTIHRDERGDVRELWRASWGTPPVLQTVRSFSRKGVIRGMHYHKRQWDIWSFVEGEARVQLYEPDTADWKYLHSVGPETTIVIPPRVAHGFQALTDCILVYGLTEEYTGTDEYGFDPLFGWPGAGLWAPGEPIISERERNAPALADFLATL